MFSQETRTADRSQGGLAFVKSLVELHHSGITAISKGRGKGREFRVQLPRHSAPAIKRSSSNGGETKTNLVSLKLMVVDDNIDAANMVAMYLETSGHEVIIEHASQTALKRARSEHMNVFLLDIGLLDMDGNELARQLRSLPELASSCFIAVSGYGQEQEKKSTTEAGFDYHFVKPADMTILTSILAELGNLTKHDMPITSSLLSASLASSRSAKPGFA